MEKSYDDMPTELKQWTIKQINDLINGKLRPMKARKIIAMIASSVNSPVGDLICDIVTLEDEPMPPAAPTPEQRRVRWAAASVDTGDMRCRMDEFDWI